MSILVLPPDLAAETQSGLSPMQLQRTGHCMLQFWSVPALGAPSHLLLHSPVPTLTAIAAFCTALIKNRSEITLS